MLTLLFILIVIFLLFSLLFLDFYFGKRKEQKKRKDLSYSFRYTDFHIYADGTELFPALFGSVKNAQEHIHILFYTIKTDHIGTEFLQLLQQKAKEGVEVRLLLDWLGSFTVRKKIRQQLKDAGVQFAFSQTPRFPFLFYSLQVRNHRKIAIIDGKIGYMGGFNVGRDYIHANLKLSPWRDYHVKMIGEGVDDLQREFLIDWKAAYKVNLMQNNTYFPLQKKGKTKHQIIPTQGGNLEDILYQLIKDSKKSLCIGTPYFIPSQKILKELTYALERGIDITILIPFKADHPLVKEASYRFLRVLLKKGATVLEYKNGFFHGKLINIDNNRLIIGSANFDQRSLFLNHELNCFIYDQVFIDRMNEIVQIDLENASKLKIESLMKPNVWRTCKELVARCLTPFL